MPMPPLAGEPRPRWFGNSIAFEDYSLEQALALMREAGFTGVEMWKPHLRRCRTAALRERFRDQARELGLALGGLNAVGEAYFQPFGGDREREETLRGLCGDIDYALSLGVRDVLIWEGVKPSGLNSEAVRERLLPPLLELFRSVLRYAEPRGARLLIEPHPFTVGMDDRLLISLFDQLDSECFGITYDFCHYGVGRPDDYIQAVSKLGRRIRHIHFADSDQRSSELHFAPGDGCMDLAGLLAAFQKIPYDGTITLDLYGNPMPIAAAQRGIPRLREACQRLGIG